MLKKIPIIGMTKKFHLNKTLSLDYIAKNIDSINFLNAILPKDQINVKSVNKEFIQLVYNKPLNYQIISELTRWANRDMKPCKLRDSLVRFPR